MWWLRCGCQQAITLYNPIQANTFAKVRVTAVGPATKIISASGGGWTQIANYPTSVEWTPPGGFVPIGAPIPNAFSIRVEKNYLPGKRVLFEWLDEEGDTVCSQLLATPCPASEEPFDTETKDGSERECICVKAVTTADPVSLELIEPDIDADIDTPVRLSRTQYKFLDISEIEPLGIPVQTQWIVTKHDALNEEQVITPTMTFDAGGNPTVDFPGPGRYTVYLHITAPNCSEEEIDTNLRTVEIAELKAAFNWEQTYCTPNQIQFTDASTADASTPIVSWLWELYDLNGTTLLSTQTLQNINHTYATFPTGTQTYKVCLTVTNSSGDTDQICKNISFGNACKAEFEWKYTACQEGPITVNFVNKSVVPLCPANSEWDFGDGNTSSQFSPAHTYTSMGQYQVHLKMTDANGNTCNTTHVITVHPCPLNFTVTVCPDCWVIFETFAPSPKWSFPQGTPSSSTDAKVKVQYQQAGTYTAHLTSTDQNFCSCTKGKDFVVGECKCCARNDHQKGNYDFSYNGSDYRMKYKFVQRNMPLLHYMKGKTKLKKRNSSGIYRAAKASEIQVKWDGHIYKSIGDCNCADEQAENQDRSRTNKTKSKETHHIGAKFRTRKNSVTSTHYLKVDSNHSGVTINLMLGQDCD